MDQSIFFFLLYLKQQNKQKGTKRLGFLNKDTTLS